MLVDCIDSVENGGFYYIKFSKITVTVNVTDNKSGINTIEIKVGDSTSWTPMSIEYKNADKTTAVATFPFFLGGTRISGTIPYKFRLTDNVGNSIMYDKEGNLIGDPAPPAVSDLSLYADDNRAYVASGDKVYASFTAADDYSGVDNDSVYVTFTGNKRVQAEYDEATGKFIAGVSYDGLPDLTKITVDSISIKDIAGNEISYNRQQLSCSGEIHFLEQISVSNISFVRSKPLSGPNVAKNGDELTLSFNTNHAIIQKQVLIDGVEVSLDEKIYTHSNTYKYTAVATVAGNTADGDAIPFSVTIGDEAGNEDYTFTNSSVDDVIYYAPIAVSNQEMITSGNNRSFFKDDDEIRISFSTQHEVYLDSGSKIAGKLLTLGLTPCADAPLTYEIVSKIDKDSIDDEEKISAVINIIDLAGNTATVDFRNTGLVYYAPINAKVSIRSDSRDNRYVGNGGKVTVTVEANHPVSVKSTRIAGRKASTPKTARVFTTSYTIPANESHLKEGKLSLALVLTDEAGNERVINQVTDTSSVTYDKSRPTIGVSPIFSGFTSDGVSYTFTFRDNNLYGGGISVKVNGNERMTSSDRSSAYGDSFDKTVALNDEGDYDILVTCADRAGNLAQSKSFRLSIDKTVPTISTSVTLSTDTVPVFMKGFVIADYLEITEEHIKDIICKVSDSSGSKSWDISEPIVTDGKKTISVIVNDMADNTSNALTFDVYIDATAPTISVEELITQVPLSADTSDTFEGAMTLDIGCVGSTVSSAYADEFKTLKLLSSDGSVYHDFLASGSSDRYTLELDKFGDYVLVLEAVDHAGGDATTIGNTTGELHYAFTYRDKSFLRKYYENKFLFYGSIAVLLGAIALVLVLYLRKKNAPITESI